MFKIPNLVFFSHVKCRVLPNNSIIGSIVAIAFEPGHIPSHLGVHISRQWQRFQPGNEGELLILSSSQTNTNTFPLGCINHFIVSEISHASYNSSPFVSIELKVKGWWLGKAIIVSIQEHSSHKISS